MQIFSWLVLKFKKVSILRLESFIDLIFRHACIYHNVILILGFALPSATPALNIFIPLLYKTSCNIIWFLKVLLVIFILSMSTEQGCFGYWGWMQLDLNGDPIFSWDRFVCSLVIVVCALFILYKNIFVIQGWNSTYILFLHHLLLFTISI